MHSMQHHLRVNGRSVTQCRQRGNDGFTPFARFTSLTAISDHEGSRPIDVETFDA